jgi:hypothetical protein
MRLFQVFLDNFLYPIRNIKLQYLPILTVYFASGFACFYGIAETFWIKDSLSLSPDQIVVIQIWANMPWSMKIILAQIIDSIRIGNSYRKPYIFIGALSMVIGISIIILLARNNIWLLSLTSAFNLLIISGCFMQVGIVLQDLVADTLCYEIVPKQINGMPRDAATIRTEIGAIQQISRIVEIGAAIIGVGISGYLAENLDYSQVAIGILLVPILSIVGALFVKENAQTEALSGNGKLLLGGLIYLVFIISMASIKFEYNQEIIFIVAMIIVIALLKITCEHLDKVQKKEVFGILLMFFAFRAVPTYSPGIDWWQIDELGFNPKFKANLDQINLILGFLGVWLFAKKALKTDLRLVLLVLTLIHVALQLPMVAMSFGLHHWTMEHFGFGAKSIALFDASVEGPFQRLGYLLLTAALTYYAPKKNIASWFALSMGLMSLAFVYMGRIIKKYLAKIYIIERGDYHNIKGLLVATTSLNLLLPLVAIIIVSLFFMKEKKLRRE